MTVRCYFELKCLAPLPTPLCRRGRSLRASANDADAATSRLKRLSSHYRGSGAFASCGPSLRAGPRSRRCAIRATRTATRLDPRPARLPDFRHRLSCASDLGRLTFPRDLTAYSDCRTCLGAAIASATTTERTVIK